MGTWGQKVLPKLNQVCEVVSCSNRYNLNAEKWLLKNYPDISHTFDYNEILNNGYIEAVIVTTPIETHCGIVNDCLDAGKHVFVEKPLATNSSDVEKLFQKAKKNNLNLFVGYIYTYNKKIWTRECFFFVRGGPSLSTP